MFRQLKKTLVATVIASLTLGSILPAFADTADTLPDMGTSAGSTLSIGQEMQMGDYYVRQLRGSAPLINDPLLVQYINGLGMRLVAHANSVRTPFHFYLINNDQINAFAFFGGNVVLHSALFRYSDNESELASVMAHEISHVTQRHLARAMEDQKRNAPLTWVGALGSILLAMASPQAGMAALTGTLAGSQQGLISFTRQNEEEADRIGMVNRVVPDAELMTATYDMARTIAAKPQQAVRFFRRAVYQSQTMALATHLDMVSSHMAVLEDTPEHRAGIAAFRTRSRASK